MIQDNIRNIKRLLEKLEAYDNLITGDNFEPATVTDMKENAKGVCNQIKAEVDQIKAEIGQWE